LVFMNFTWLHRFAVLTAVATLALIGLGGLVTSHGVGMAVPDWPTTYGYNMFFFPFSQWIGGIFYEHTHRLVASFVGVLVVALMRWVGGRAVRLPLAIIGSAEVLAGYGFIKLAAIGSLKLGWLGSMNFSPQWRGVGYFLSGIGGVVLLAAAVWGRNKPAESPLPQLGWLAFGTVQLQGLLGGLRVVLFKDELGVFHAALAQLFFVMLCAVAWLTSRWWKALPAVAPTLRLKKLVLLASFLILGQLILGATLRHQHAGLTIPDFPLAYGKVWPALDPASVEVYNQHRMEITAVNPITATGIILQMAHRLLAVVILMTVAGCAWLARRELGAKVVLSRLSLVWLGCILAQGILGATVIWSNKAADLATAHVLLGAISLTLGALLSAIAWREVGFVQQRAGLVTERVSARPRFARRQPEAVFSNRMR
jgi:cytochrome c oxidase assembly protein subunit 15